MQPVTKLSERRGFDFLELYENTIGVLLVKAPIESASPAISKLLQGELEINVFGNYYDFHSENINFMLYQYLEHSWTIIYFFNISASKTVAKISKILQSSCIYLCHEDVSGWSSYELFDRGTCIEELHWGCDSRGELFGTTPEKLRNLAEEKEAQGNPLSYFNDPRKWDIYCFDDSKSYQFSSFIHTTTEEEVKNTNQFLDRLFRDLDACLPSREYCPPISDLLIEFNYLFEIRAEDLVRVDIIRGRKIINDYAIVDRI